MRERRICRSRFGKQYIEFSFGQIEETVGKPGLALKREVWVVNVNVWGICLQDRESYRNVWNDLGQEWGEWRKWDGTWNTWTRWRIQNYHHFVYVSWKYFANTFWKLFSYHPPWISSLNIIQVRCFWLSMCVFALLCKGILEADIPFQNPPEYHPWTLIQVKSCPYTFIK